MPWVRSCIASFRLQQGFPAHRAVYFRRTAWSVTLGGAFLLGCGGATSDQPAPANVPSGALAPSAPTSAAPAAAAAAVDQKSTEEVASSKSTATEAAVAAPPAATPPPPAPPIKLATPTAEQIAKWTPAPYEPLQLLAIQEPELMTPTLALDATPDGKHFLTAGAGIHWWAVGKPRPERTLLEPAADGSGRVVNTLAVSPDGVWCAAGDSTGKVFVWALDGFKEIVTKQLLSTGIVSLAISPDSKELAAITFDRDVLVCNPQTLEKLKTIKVDTDNVKRLEYIAAGRLAVAGQNTSIWDTATGDKAKELEGGRYSFALARSPAGDKFLVGARDALQVLSVADFQPQAAITGAVSGDELAAFSPDGKMLATSNGGTISIWNLAEGRLVQVLDGHTWSVSGLRWLPQTGVLVAASETARTRVWGTAAQGAAVELKPLHTPVAPPGTAGDVPAHHAQVAQVIDLRVFPRPPKCEVQTVDRGDFNAQVSAPVTEIQTFYGHFLSKDGWTLGPGVPNDPNALVFRKGAFELSVRCYEAGEGKTSTLVHLDGNFDVRKAPRFDSGPIEVVYEAANTVMYKTKVGITPLEIGLLRQFHAAGWTGYTRLNSGHNEQPDSRQLLFLRNGVTLVVGIGKFPTAPDSFTVQYSLQSNTSAVPVPTDAGYVEFDGSTDAKLVATSKQTLEQLAEFYDREMAAQGWLASEFGRSAKPEARWLSYVRGQEDVMIGLVQLPDGKSLVRVGEASTSLWDLAHKKEEPGKGKEAAGLEAADFPALKKPHTTKVDRDDKSIEVTIEKSTLAAATEQFTAALSSLGWKAEEGGIRGEDYTMVTFEKGKQEITLRARSQDGKAVVNFQGDGLLWTKELATDKEVVSFETWLRRNKLPASLEHLDRYESVFSGK